MSKIRIVGGLTALLVAVAFGEQQASAHARLVRATPAPGATADSLQKIETVFDDDLVGRYSKLTILGPSGTKIPAKPADSVNGKSLAVTPVNALQPGKYKVEWTVVSTDDGHKTRGSYLFFVK